MALEMQAVRRDDAEEPLERRERHRGGAHTRDPGAFAALQVLLELRGRAMAEGDDRLAESFAVLGEVEDGRVAGRLGPGLRRGDGGGRGEERPPQEIAPPRLDFGDLVVIEEILGRAPQLHRAEYISGGLY